MEKQIPTLGQEAIQYMIASGKIAAGLKKALRDEAQPGITTLELDQLAETYIRDHGGKPAFKNHQGFPATLITCLNHQVVHAIPSKQTLQEGDLLTIDLGAIVGGYYSDTATSFYIGEQQDAGYHFLQAGKEALQSALAQCQPGKQVGDISHAIQETIEQAGYSPVRSFTGHGIGQELHQPPQIPCLGTSQTGPVLTEGMGLAVEVMYTAGSHELRILDDGWTTVTVDKNLAAQFEETVIIQPHGHLITTS